MQCSFTCYSNAVHKEKSPHNIQWLEILLNEGSSVLFIGAMSFLRFLIKRLCSKDEPDELYDNRILNI